jgi:putative pyruvate formate lyase activating enzyme
MHVDKSSQGFEPVYLQLYRSGELRRRAMDAVAELSHCKMCPRNCGADRSAGKTGTCQIGRYARVTSYFSHHGEEDPLRGWRGSGAIFFGQ